MNNDKMFTHRNACIPAGMLRQSKDGLGTEGRKKYIASR
jgi:hypothetical protein